ncbi:PREDICTED: transmembrane protein 203-like [Amphimedon queenslandica]|uniref:Uncharacterized protein n=1 Tax=Amphimedon queenslandica TaxID=400682 RepID=A0A1X7UH52_AMPQE|nr:PREDICTED: transmembrane protein 203-like [Amphimedon queenslandica]|eukprot:XP_011405119.1 PREDICTED: transmembrane protein 203-like [Amphimedon queenslandica]
MVLLSYKESVVWLGIGPFEAFLHSSGGLVFLLLLTLRVESVILLSWSAIFIPLYVSLALDSYYSLCQATRIISYVVQNKRNILFTVIHLFLLLWRIGLLLYIEVIIPRVLEDSIPSTSLIPPFLFAISYLTLRLFPVLRLVKSSDPDYDD